MSVHYSSAVWRIVMPNSGRKLVALALADMSGDDGLTWPSLKTLMKRCDMGENAIRDHLGALCAIGLIAKRPQFKDGRQTSNLYQFVELSRIQGEGILFEPPGTGEGTPQGRVPKIGGGRVPILGRGEGTENREGENHHIETSKEPIQAASLLVGGNEIRTDKPKPQPITATKKRTQDILGKDAQRQHDEEMADLEPIPASLQAEGGFMEAWERWKLWRKRISRHGSPKGNKLPWTKNAARRALSKCEKMGPILAAEAIDESVDKWEDIFPPKEHGNYQTRTGEKKDLFVA